MSIAVSPGDPELAEGLTGQFTATGTYADGSTGDLTNYVIWSSATMSVATDQHPRFQRQPLVPGQRDRRVPGGRHQPRRRLDRDRPQLR